MRYRIPVAIFVWIVLSFGQIGIGNAQETKTMTAAEFNAAVDYLCSRARAKEDSFDRLRAEADRLVVLGAECSGALAETRLNFERAQKEADLLRLERDRRWSTWVVVAGVGSGALAGVLAGWLLLD